jgi:hypothetical protein
VRLTQSSFYTSFILKLTLILFSDQRLDPRSNVAARFSVRNCVRISYSSMRATFRVRLTLPEPNTLTILDSAYKLSSTCKCLSSLHFLSNHQYSPQHPVLKHRQSNRLHEMGWLMCISRNFHLNNQIITVKPRSVTRRIGLVV